jgi:hypothetical protein
LQAVREKVNFIKHADPDTTSFGRLCAESPLSDDMLARAKSRKRESAEFLTPSIAKRRKSELSFTSDFSPDLFSTTANVSGFSDNTLFEAGITGNNEHFKSPEFAVPKFTTPKPPISKTRSRNLNLESQETSQEPENYETISSDDPASPVFGGSRLFQRVKVTDQQISLFDKIFIIHQNIFFYVCRRKRLRYNIKNQMTEFFHRMSGNASGN